MQFRLSLPLSCVEQSVNLAGRLQPRSVCIDVDLWGASVNMGGWLCEEMSVVLNHIQYGCFAMTEPVCVYESLDGAWIHD